nr:hypothetical protein [Spirochaetota bacterium]
MKINIFIFAILIIFSFYFGCSQPKISGFTGTETTTTIVINDTSTDMTGLVGLEIIGTNIGSIF